VRDLLGKFAAHAIPQRRSHIEIEISRLRLQNLGAVVRRRSREPEPAPNVEERNSGYPIPHFADCLCRTGIWERLGCMGDSSGPPVTKDGCNRTDIDGPAGNLALPCRGRTRVAAEFQKFGGTRFASHDLAFLSTTRPVSFSRTNPSRVG
jgi:hypothetical protein